MDNLLNSEATTALILLGILIVTYGILRSIFFPAVKKLANRTSTFIDDLFLDKKFLNRLSYVIVFIIFNILTATPEFNIDLFKNVIVSRLIDAAFALLVGLTILEVLSVFNKISEKIDVLKDRPIKGYIQILKIIISAFVVIIIFAIVTGQSVAYYISGLGALTAVSYTHLTLPTIPGV